jgi:D-alanyl-D-alanine carboxypeptidase
MGQGFRAVAHICGALAVAAATGCDRGQGAVAVTVAASPAPTPPPSRVLSLPAFESAVDALAADLMQRGPVAGLSVAVVERGRTLLAKGYGYADQEAGIAATTDTSYPIASVTKHVTASLVLRLADRGRLGLDDPLSCFFPAARPQIGELTVRRLLDHTSGLTRGGPSPRAAAASVLARGGTAWPQGQDWDYSNYSFSLLGLVIEQVTGRSYAQHVQDELAPLGLAGTGYCEDGSHVPGRTVDYQWGRKTVSPTPYWTEARFFAAGGLCSTVLDLVRFEAALEQGRVVSPAALRAMRTPVTLPSGLTADYGLGTRLGITAGRRKLGHTGGGQSNKAVLAHFPDDEVTVAVLLNTEGASSHVAATDLEVAIERLLFPPESPPPAGEPAVLADPARLVGVYRNGPGLVRVDAADGALRWRPRPDGKADSLLLAQGGDVFLHGTEPGVELRFQSRDGAAVGFGRYHNGWFVGRGLRSAGVALTAP